MVAGFFSLYRGSLYQGLSVFFYQGKVAVAPCLIGNGFEYYKCNPTHSGLAPSWHNTVNVSQCIRQPFLRWQRKVSFILDSVCDSKLQKKNGNFRSPSLAVDTFLLHSPHPPFLIPPPHQTPPLYTISTINDIE